MIKICKACGKEFDAQRAALTCSVECKEIVSTRNRESAEYREREALRIRKRRAIDPVQQERDRAFKKTEEYKAQQKAYQQAKRDKKEDWASLHPEAKQRYDSEYAKGNRQRLNARAREYHQKHPEYAQRTKARYRLLSKNAGPVPPARVIAKRLSLLGGCCYCKREVRLTLEHLVSLHNGGDHRVGNLFGACRTCNCSKQERDWKEWFMEQKFYDPARMAEIELACGQMEESWLRETT